MRSTVRLKQRLSAWFLVLGNEDREAFLDAFRYWNCPAYWM
jgi:hypothetical protein